MRLERREFIRGGMMAALCAPASAAIAADGPKSDEGVKFCAFSDIHYFPGRFPHDSKEWLGRILDRAEKNRCDFAIHMGDFTHNPVKAKDYVDFYNDFKLPTYHTVGNHDFDQCTPEETFGAYRMENGHYFFDRNGFRFIATDTNYSYSNGQWRHYGDKSKPYSAKGNILDRVPPAELEWLRATIESSPYPCVVTSHASYEREDGSPDRVAVRKIFNDANRRNPGRVRLVINGHYHCDHVRLLDGIVYLDLNSANFCWVGLVHKAYPAEDTKKYVYMQNLLAWNDPLSATITLTRGGRIRIDGYSSTFYRDVDPLKAGFPQALHGRAITPYVQSFDITMAYPAPNAAC